MKSAQPCVPAIRSRTSLTQVALTLLTIVPSKFSLTNSTTCCRSFNVKEGNSPVVPLAITVRTPQEYSDDKYVFESLPFDFSACIKRR